MEVYKYYMYGYIRVQCYAWGWTIFSNTVRAVCLYFDKFCKLLWHQSLLSNVHFNHTPFTSTNTVASYVATVFSIYFNNVLKFLVVCYPKKIVALREFLISNHTNRRVTFLNSLLFKWLKPLRCAPWIYTIKDNRIGVIIT